MGYLGDACFRHLMFTSCLFLVQVLLEAFTKFHWIPKIRCFFSPAGLRDFGAACQDARGGKGLNGW